MNIGLQPLHSSSPYSSKCQPLLSRRTMHSAEPGLTDPAISRCPPERCFQRLGDPNTLKSRQATLCTHILSCWDRTCLAGSGCIVTLFKVDSCIQQGVGLIGLVGPFQFYYSVILLWSLTIGIKFLCFCCLSGCGRILVGCSPVSQHTSHKQLNINSTNHERILFYSCLMFCKSLQRCGVVQMC